MRRKMDSSFDVWIRSSHRKPLVLFGARGVGKTTLLEGLAQRTQRDLIHVDFSVNPYAASVFERTEDPREILRNLEALMGQNVNPENALLVLDEIQLCDDALMSLRRFKTDFPELPVAAAGSSLGVHLARGSHAVLPTEHVNTETVHPLDFEEFCWALGEGPSYDIAAECARELKPCPIHEKMMGLYREYLLVGGMPQTVERYAQTRQIDDARSVQESIQTLYMASMSLDAEGVDPSKIAATWKSLPAQLAKSTGSTKFMWKYIARGAKAERYASALEWLQQAGFVNLCTQVSGGGAPVSSAGYDVAQPTLKAYENPSAFKAYVADTGLLSRAYGATLADVAEASPDEAPFRQPLFSVGLAENFVMQELVAAGEQPYYWGMKSKHEAQFVLQTYDRPIPIDVNPGQKLTRATAARDFATRYDSPYVLQVSGQNISRRYRNDLEVRTVPPYALSQLVA
ncbi:MAG: ATP-binding protein [Eggerthellaceae bacterium]|nr:ATP-binding protein [Eggerthellaceae bacterium]